MTKINNLLGRLKAISRRNWFGISMSLLLVLFTAGCAARKEPLLFAAGFVITVMYIIITVLRIRRELKKSSVSKGTDLARMMISVGSDIGSPVVVIYENGNICWSNRAACEAFSLKNDADNGPVHEAISDALDEEGIICLSSGNNIRISYKDDIYEVSAIRIDGDFPVTALVFERITELVLAREEIKNSNVVVAYVMIDNFSEAMQFVQDKYRTAMALIGSVLEGWCNDLGGIMRESEKDKYMFIFEERHLENLIACKFDILDRIRSIEFEGIDIPFTASVGLSGIKGTFAHKEIAARQALDLALQRGGDQAVVKTEKGTDIFGGRFKSVQKRTKIRSRIIADELMNLFKAGGNVLIQGHRFADHDCIAACVGMAKIARIAGSEPKIIVNIHDTNLKPVFAMMRGKKEFSELFVDAMEAQDLIRSDTINVVCDVNNPLQFEAPDVYENAYATVIIDHHRKIGEFTISPRISYIEPSASSASELICEMLEQVCQPGELSQVEADLLFSGLILDTKQFTKNTGVRTFGAAQYLRSEGAEPMNAGSLFNSGLDEFKRQNEFEAEAAYYGKDIIISSYDGECGFPDKIMLAKAADRLLGVAGVRATFTMCMIGEDTYVSARSNGTINVQLILEALGGGGHYDAAGAQVKGTSIDGTYALLCEAIDKYMSDEGNTEQSENV